MCVFKRDLEANSYFKEKEKSNSDIPTYTSPFTYTKERAIKCLF
jgi:hypothetical protein